MTTGEKFTAALLGAFIGLLLGQAWLIIVDMAMDHRDKIRGIDSRAVIEEVLR